MDLQKPEVAASVAELDGPNQTLAGQLKGPELDALYEELQSKGAEITSALLLGRIKLALQEKQAGQSKFVA